MNTFLDTKLEFNKKKHRYVYEGIELTSVTTFISDFFTPFNADEVSKKLSNFPINKANKKGIRFWKAKWKNSQVEGSKIHKEIEDFINENKEPLLPKSLQGTKFIKSNELNILPNILLTELKIFSLKYKLAGTIDALLFKNNIITIIDWKTNEKIDKKSYGNKVGCTEETKDIPDSNYWHYALQLNFYKKILEEEYGIIINELQLIHLKNDSYDIISIPFMEDVVNKMLEVK